MSLAFDADVLIYAAIPGNRLGQRVWQILEDNPGEAFGSTLLLPEMLIKPSADERADDIAALVAVLARLEMVEVTEAISRLAVQLGASYSLRAADAVHLATGVWIGAERFVTNNTKDFRPAAIEEIDVVTPVDL